jgi:L-fuconolactonase
MSDRPVNRDAWRAQVGESALEPDLPIIDAHHHLWPEAPVPHMEAYGVAALTADKAGSGHNIQATVFAEAYTRYRTDGPASLRPVGESDFIEGVGREADEQGGRVAGLCAALVANADMMLGDAVEEVLIAHREASPGRFRGIRYLLAHDPDFPLPLTSKPGTMGNAIFRAALARFARHNLTFDVWLMHPQLPELADLAAAFPDTTFILDHVGSPMATGRYANNPEGALEEWRKGMKMVASCPNVMLKLGGLNMEFTGLGAPLRAERPWTSEKMAEAQRSHILTAIDLFAPSRCMFESNFPVDRLATNATALWNGFKRVVAGFSTAEKAQLFAGTASRVYSVNAPN